MTLDEAKAGDERAFEQLVGQHTRELRIHCYRILGSTHDADEAVQETLLAAWRSLPDFEGRSSLRTWLYRIATHASLRLAQRRPARMLSWDLGAARDPLGDLGVVVTDPVFVDPWTDETEPASAYGRRETIELAWVAALQHLPANQRAVLVLRDVLAFSAAETAELLDTTVASANSALQRARDKMSQRLSERSQQEERRVVDPGLVDAFVEAFERADVNALVTLLAADVRFTMPPLPAWLDGISDVATFFSERIFAAAWRQVRIDDVNGQPAVLGYMEQDGELRLGALQVLGFRDGRISWVAAFLEPGLLRRLGLPEVFEEGATRQQGHAG